MTQPAANDGELAKVAFRAVTQGNLEALVRALDAGVPVDLDDQAGNTLLMLAAYHGRPEATAVLLERGAEPNRTNPRDHTPLCGAALRGDARSALLLLERGARELAQTMGVWRTQFWLG